MTIPDPPAPYGQPWPAYVLKIFHEEPAALGTPAVGVTGDEAGTAEAFLASLANAPRYHRLYLAGSVAPREGHAEATGLSALPRTMWAPALAAALAPVPETPAEPSQEVLRQEVLRPDRRSPALSFLRGRESTCQPPTDVSPATVAALAPGEWKVLAGNGSSPGPTELRSDDTPTHLAALRALLDNGCAVLHAEPAPDGFDLHVFSSLPLLDRLVAALPPRESGQRRFAARFRALRSEAKFYFERWGTLPPPAGLVEV